jgi:predicted O-methyltransferase YrrM
MNLINKDYIEKFLSELVRLPETSTMLEIRHLAEKEGYPILRPSTAAFLNVLIGLKKPVSALEIGTSIGYSGSLILQAMGPEGRLITVDSDEDILETARKYFEKQGVANRVTLIAGDGGDVLHHLEDSFDFIFLDGPKAQYLLYLPDCIRLLRNGGVLVCDDVLFYGMVAKDELVRKRKITIVKRMRKFLRSLVENPAFDTTIVPIGDGISISVKKEVEF